MDRLDFHELIKEHFGVILGLKKATPEELHEEWDAQMRQKYYDPIERFPERIDLLLNAINRVCQIFAILYEIFLHFV